MPQLRLNQKWFNGLKSDEHVEFEERWLKNKDLFAQLATIVQQKVDAVQRERRSKTAYDKPAWSEFQADTLGYERALEEVLTYLKLSKENTDA